VLVLALIGTAVGTTNARAVATKTTADPNLYEQFGKMQNQVETQGDEVKFVFAFLGLLLSLSVAGFVFAERRTHRAHNLAMAGEEAAQQRAAEVHTRFLEGSLKTLSLVNETLALERMASERAVQANEEKARRELAELDNAAKALIANVPSGDDHALVTNPASQSEVASLAAKINKFEINRFHLASEMPLKPHCQFIRGVQLHVEQHFDDAFDAWEAIVLNDHAPGELQSLTWYWMGRERMNLAHYDKAEVAFQQGRKHANEARSYELERIRMERRLFDLADNDGVQLVQDLERLVNTVEAVGSEAAIKALPGIKATLGNVHHSLAHECRAAARVEEARVHFERAVAIFESIPDVKWAVFGLAEALWWIGRRSRAEHLFLKEGRPFAQNEYVHRPEARVKVLARFAELLCCARVGALRSEADHIYQDVIDVLGRVDHRMTIYSELSRRNVTKRELQADLNELLAQAKQPPDPI
jgi:tetratricopeptide (TPR) repeat protein